jgi:hypothetical protein
MKHEEPLTNKLTPWSWARLEKPPAVQLLKNVPKASNYENQHDHKVTLGIKMQKNSCWKGLMDVMFQMKCLQHKIIFIYSVPRHILTQRVIIRGGLLALRVSTRLSVHPFILQLKVCMVECIACYTDSLNF